MEEKKPTAPEEGPHGVDRWTSNGYGLTIDGIEVKPAAKENEHGEHAEEHEAHKRDLVARGANQEADICLFKGMDADSEETPHEEAPTASPTVSKSDHDRYDYIIEAFP